MASKIKVNATRFNDNNGMARTLNVRQPVQFLGMPLPFSKKESVNYDALVRDPIKAVPVIEEMLKNGQDLLALASATATTSHIQDPRYMHQESDGAKAEILATLNKTRQAVTERRGQDVADNIEKDTFNLYKKAGYLRVIQGRRGDYTFEDYKQKQTTTLMVASLSV